MDCCEDWVTLQEVHQAVPLTVNAAQCYCVSGWMPCSWTARWDLPDMPSLFLKMWLWLLVSLSHYVSSSISSWLQSFPFSWDGHFRIMGFTWNAQASNTPFMVVSLLLHSPECVKRPHLNCQGVYKRCLLGPSRKDKVALDTNETDEMGSPLQSQRILESLISAWGEPSLALRARSKSL